MSAAQSLRERFENANFLTPPPAAPVAAIVNTQTPLEKADAALDAAAATLKQDLEAIVVDKENAYTENPQQIRYHAKHLGEWLMSKTFDIDLPVDLSPAQIESLPGFKKIREICAAPDVDMYVRVNKPLLGKAYVEVQLEEYPTEGPFVQNFQCLRRRLENAWNPIWRDKPAVPFTPKPQSHAQSPMDKFNTKAATLKDYLTKIIEDKEHTYTVSHNHWEIKNNAKMIAKWIDNDVSIAVPTGLTKEALLALPAYKNIHDVCRAADVDMNVTLTKNIFGLYHVHIAMNEGYDAGSKSAQAVRKAAMTLG